jgi:hypothetical protein
VKLAALGAVLALLFRKQLLKLLRRDAFETHATEDDVRAAIGAYLDGQISLADLDRWLMTRTWDDSDAPPLAHQAQLLLAESDRGDRPDLSDDLRVLASEAGHRTERLIV